MKNKKISLVIIIVMMLVTISCSLPQCSNSLSNDETNSIASNQGNQIKISLPDGASLELDPGSLPNDVKASMELISQEKRSYDEFSQVGSLYEISLGSAVLNEPATLTLPYDPEALPEDVDPETLFIAYFDENVQDWQFVGGDVDTENHLISVKTDHASRWSVFTWNWDAWIAVLDKILSLNLVSWYEAVDLLTDDCLQSGEGVWVDSTKSGNLIQGCIEEEEETEVVLRIVNPKSFYYEIAAESDDNSVKYSELLSPGGSYEFRIDKLDPPPVEVRAEISQKAGYRLFVHWFLSYLPGLNSADIKPQELDCLAERLEQEGIPIVSSVIDDLIGGDTTSGLKASISLTELWLDIDFLEIFLEEAGVCIDYLPATWSLDNISQIASSSSVIIEGWDFLANYIAMMHRGSSQVIFNWTQLGTNSDRGQILYKDGSAFYLLDINSKNSKLLIEDENVGYGRISPDGQYLAYTRGYDDPDMWPITSLKVMNLNTGQMLNLINLPEDINTFIWSVEPGHITLTRRNHQYCETFDDQRISGLYDYNLDTGELNTLDSGSDQYVVWAYEWSQDGQYLLFAAGPDCSSGRFLMVYDTETDEVSGVPYGEGTWAPEGDILAVNELLYYEYRDVPLIEYKIATGESNVLVEKTGYYVSNPAWSGDGEWIAFNLSPVDNYDPAPWLLNRKSGDLIQVEIPGGKPDYWDPSGKNLILSVTKGQMRDVYLFDTTTKEVVLLLENLSGGVMQWVNGK